MKSGWRLCNSKFAGSIPKMMSGQGAFLAGGRWNSPGTRIVYLGSTLSLATLEVIVHLQKPAVLASYSKLEVFFDEKDIQTLDTRSLPANWFVPAVNSPVQHVGDDWAKAQSALILKVPSAVTTGEWNYLVNVEHPRFSSLKYGAIEIHSFDERLVTLLE